MRPVDAVEEVLRSVCHVDYLRSVGRLTKPQKNIKDVPPQRTLLRFVKSVSDTDEQVNMPPATHTRQSSEASQDPHFSNGS